MIHIDQGGNKTKTKDFFDELNSCHIKYDVIGQSFYPWWQGSLNDLRENMIFMAQYKKAICIVEVAYSWPRQNTSRGRDPIRKRRKGKDSVSKK